MNKRTHRRTAVVAGVALSLGLAAPAMANVFVGSPNTNLNVDPGAVSAIANVAGVSNDLAPTTTFGLGLASILNTLALSDVSALNTLALTDAAVASAIAAPYRTAVVAIAGDAASDTFGIAGGLASDAGDYLNMNSAPAIIAAVGTLF
jgi:hypothetical protein